MDGSGTILTGIVVLADWVRAFLAVVPNQAIVGLRTSTFVGSAALAVLFTSTAGPVLCRLRDRVHLGASLLSGALSWTTLDIGPPNRIEIPSSHRSCRLPANSSEESVRAKKQYPSK
jgi:hypothetical protein